MGRGIERKEIFFSDADRSDFLDKLAVLDEEGALDVSCLGANAESFSSFVQDPKPAFVVEHAENINRLCW